MISASGPYRACLPFRRLNGGLPRRSLFADGHLARNPAGQKTKMGRTGSPDGEEALQREKGCATVMHLMMVIRPGD
jgi:hypothetical protein